MATVQAQDILPVRSRVSFSAIFAGAVVALALILLLSLLGGALGLSLSNHMHEHSFNVGAAVWAVVTVLLSLFAGGCVATRCAVGETTGEALIHGTIMWGLVFALLLWLTTAGIRMGFNAALNTALTAVNLQVNARLSDADLQAAGFSQEEIARFRSQFDRLRAANLPAEAQAQFEQNRDTAVRAAWWTFGGVLLSLLAALAGALAGAGPQVVLTRLGFRRTVVATTPPQPR
jgi:hypothetical protein